MNDGGRYRFPPPRLRAQGPRDSCFRGAQFGPPPGLRGCFRPPLGPQCQGVDEGNCLPFMGPHGDLRMPPLHPRIIGERCRPPRVLLPDHCQRPGVLPCLPPPPGFISCATRADGWPRFPEPHQMPPPPFESRFGPPPFLEQGSVRLQFPPTERGPFPMDLNFHPTFPPGCVVPPHHPVFSEQAFNSGVAQRPAGEPDYTCRMPYSAGVNPNLVPPDVNGTRPPFGDSSYTSTNAMNCAPRQDEQQSSEWGSGTCLDRKRKRSGSNGPDDVHERKSSNPENDKQLHSEGSRDTRATTRDPRGSNNLDAKYLPKGGLDSQNQSAAVKQDSSKQEDSRERELSSSDGILQRQNSERKRSRSRNRDESYRGRNSTSRRRSISSERSQSKSADTRARSPRQDSSWRRGNRDDRSCRARGLERSRSRHRSRERRGRTPDRRSGRESRGRSSSRDQSCNRSFNQSGSSSFTNLKQTESVTTQSKESAAELAADASAGDQTEQLTDEQKLRIPDDDDIFLEDDKEEQIPDWIRSSPADLFFRRDKLNLLMSTKRMQDLERKFENELVKRAEKVRASKPPVILPPRKEFIRHSRSPSLGSSNSGDESEEDDSEENEEKTWMAELTWRKNHPERLHEELWFNLPHEMNDGPLCRCSSQNLHYGIRHNIYPGEKPVSKCNPHTNNPDKLFHYRITMSPHTNFLLKSPTLIEYDSHEYIFEGFSLFSHHKIEKVPLCKVIRFNIEYTIHYFEEEMIENFDVRSLDLFADFLYREILELVDLDWAGKDYDDTCRRFHIMPRFSRALPDNGKEILSMNEVLMYMLRSSKMLCGQAELPKLLKLDETDWQNFVGDVRGMIVTYPGMRPCSLRIDQLDREQKDPDVITYPKIIHFGVRPAQLSYAGDSTYQKLWKQYIRMKHLVTNQPKVLLKDREKLRAMEEQLQEIRLKGTMKRETTIEISSEGFIRTGLKADVCQHALLLPVLIQHLLFHKCLDILEERISYMFSDRLLLQLALTHPSFRMNYGTNADHARNSLTNCGKRQLEYGDKRIHFIHTRKRGINTLMHIMSKMARTQVTPSEIHHYERLEFLGDAVIEFLSSIHLFFMFPRLEEGGLATYRAALVQNQHLTVLAEKLGLHHFILYAHGPDLCHERNIKHALANCFEAVMGALFLDGGIDVVDRVFGEVLFKDQAELHHVWVHLPLHPLQEDEPKGDRHWISQSQPLQNLVKFEEATGIVFNHIRLLARAFTMRNIGYNNLTLGHNQTLEFLGDTILQLISSEYLYKHFPDHHEGHLTLLRSSLVNNRTQAIICDDLGMTYYVINNDLSVKERMDNERNKVKDKADIVEAFIGSLYVDQGLSSCKVFCQVCFFPRLKEFIIHQDWNDAKSQLQQCCLTLRDTSVGEPDIPVYKVLQTIGPTNTRKYHVAVYFRGERLATGVGHSIQQAEMNTAANALREKADMFPHLLHTKQFLDWRFGRQLREGDDNDQTSSQGDREKSNRQRPVVRPSPRKPDQRVPVDRRLAFNRYRSPRRRDRSPYRRRSPSPKRRRSVSPHRASSARGRSTSVSPPRKSGSSAQTSESKRRSSSRTPVQYSSGTAN